MSQHEVNVYMPITTPGRVFVVGCILYSVLYIENRPKIWKQNLTEMVCKSLTWPCHIFSELLTTIN